MRKLQLEQGVVSSPPRDNGGAVDVSDTAGNVAEIQRRLEPPRLRRPL